MSAGLAADRADGGLALEWRPGFTVNPALTWSVHRRGGGDPAFRVAPDGALWRTCLTPDGPASVRVHVPAVGGAVSARAWGPGARWLLGSLPASLGALDAGRLPAARGSGADVLRDIADRYQSLRIGRTGRVFEALVPAVLEQKVVGKEAHRAWRTLLYKYGTPAPGPAPSGMRVFPPPRVWARIPSWDWHRAGLEGIRAETIINAARVASRLEEIVTLGPAEADARLRSLPGIGPWTSAEIRQRANGDTDAISVGDYHLPGQVGWTLIGRRDITD